MALSQGRDRLEVMVLEAHDLLAVDGGQQSFCQTHSCQSIAIQYRRT